MKATTADSMEPVMLVKSDTSDRRFSITLARIGCYIVLIFLTVLCLFFFYMLLINCTRNHYEIQKGFSILPGGSLYANFHSLANNASLPVSTGILNSFLVAALSAALATYFSAMTAYGVFAYNFKFKNAIFATILLIMTMPTQISALGFVQEMTKIGLFDSLIPLFLPSIASPVVVFFMKQYLESNMPMEIVEAARIDGSGELQTFNHIVVPILKPAIAVQAIFSFVAAWNNFFVPALLLNNIHKKTLPILIMQLRSADFLRFDMGQVYLMIAVSIFPVMIVYFCLSKFIIRGVALGSVKG